MRRASSPLGFAERRARPPGRWPAGRCACAWALLPIVDAVVVRAAWPVVRRSDGGEGYPFRLPVQWAWVAGWGEVGRDKSSPIGVAAVTPRVSQTQAPVDLERYVSIRPRRLGADLEIPVEDLLAGPEQNIAFVADRLEDAAEVLGPVRCAHDVRMHRDRHDAGGAFGVGVDLLELIDGAIVEFRRLVVLDQHHG